MQADALVVAQQLVKSVRELLIPGTGFEELGRLAEGLKRTDLARVSALTPLRVKVLGNITTDYLTDHLRLMLVRAGFAPEITPGHYGALIRGLMGETDLSPASCDAAVLVLTHRDLQFPPPLGASAEAARELLNKEVELWSGLLKRCGVPAAILSFDLPPHRVLEEQDGLMPGGLSWHARMTNLELAARLPATQALVDAEALQGRLGALLWHDTRLYHLCKQPFAMEALPEIAASFSAALTGLLGKARKVLVLDLDNTLWGGVVGDEGLAGIELGPESPEGEAFVHFQTYVKSLAQRGIVLAVCSKNRDEIARAPFREHTGMVLKEEDIACFVANFNDKAANLRHIARTLNVGIDSLVFVDDNPVERAQVRAELPEVLVVELPDEPAHYAQAVEAAKAFPLRVLTSEDLSRSSSYQAMSNLREAAAGDASDMDAFLSGLVPVAAVEKVDSSSVDRIVQLIRKTNQFKLNLTGIQEEEVLGEPQGVVALRLTDRLQDYGIVAIAVTRADGDVLTLRNWVMSCRVFGRRLEHVMVELLCRLAVTEGCSQISGLYTPTAKNVILPEILSGLGFSERDGVYTRPVAAEPGPPHHMTIVDKRAAPEAALAAEPQL